MTSYQQKVSNKLAVKQQLAKQTMTTYLIHTQYCYGNSI